MKPFWTKVLLHYLRRPRPTLGVNLIELIVAVLMSTIVVLAILGALNSIASSARDERVLNRTQSEIDAALNFMTDELREAVYVYTGPELEATINATFNLPADHEPVLVFWKSEPVPYDNVIGVDVRGLPTACSEDDFPDLAARIDCLELINERRSFTLVAYFLDNDTSNDDANGAASIRRLQLRKYVDDAVDGNGRLTLLRSPGYVDPLKESTFAAWPFDNAGNNLQGGTRIAVTDGVDGTAPILVDFIDAGNNAAINAAALPPCNENILIPAGADPNGQLDAIFNDRYVPTPAEADAANPTNTSFYSCVRQIDARGGNQDLLVYLRGNPDGRERYRYNPDGATPLPTASTQVITRGTIDKRPTE